ncbi:hypothetical protein J437_LFUL002457 [Ladona fulva]|uniref:PLA2c domain-containing protein n=1 Tax=Ladona fulva TaxID=123851 RepID=A0A8K0KP43_LADFU|nr:hypothetical protein J437_LFUL002457 [Ladona fulva]
MVKYNKIPIMGVLASGGGYRALIGYAGALAALQKCGILDCVTYIAGGDADVFKKKVPCSLDTTDSPRGIIKALPIVEKDSLVFQGQNGTFTRFRRRKRANLQESGDGINTGLVVTLATVVRSPLPLFLVSGHLQ